MTKMAKKITEEFISFTEICYPFMWDSVKKEEKLDIFHTLKDLIDSEIMIQIELGFAEAKEEIMCKPCSESSEDLCTECEDIAKHGLKTPREIDETCTEVLVELFGEGPAKMGKLVLNETRKIQDKRLDILDQLLKDNPKKTPEELDELFGESGGYKS